MLIENGDAKVAITKHRISPCKADLVFRDENHLSYDNSSQVEYSESMDGHQSQDIVEADEEAAPPYEHIQTRFSFSQAGSHTEAILTGKRDYDATNHTGHDAHILFR
jgi:hypothetical protein